MAATVSASAIVAGGFAFPEQAAAQSSTERRIDVDIPPQDLNSALLQFTQRAGLQIVYTDEKVAGLRSSAVKGRFTPVEALSRLLVGTGLTFRFTGENRVTLEPAPESADGAIQLGPVRVEGSDGVRAAGAPPPKTDLAATDRSQSYAARAATVAGKEAQLLREIPQSVTVVTRQRIDDQNIVSLEDALRQTTGVTAIPFTPGTSSYFQVRGYPAEIQFDGIPTHSTGIQYSTQFDMAMYDRVEVLRGPSGLLQGQGSPAGTVNLVRKRPHDTFGWAASLMGGSWNTFHGDLDVTGPINSAGTVRGRFVAAGQDRDAFVDEEHEYHVLVSGVLEFDLTPGTTLTIAGAYQDQFGNPFSYGQPAYVNGEFLDAPRSQFYGVDWSRSSFRKREIYGSLDQDLGGEWTARVSGSYRWDREKRNYGYVFGPAQLNNSANFILQANASDRDVGGVDAYISGPIYLLGRRHSLLIGANYSSYVETYSNGLQFKPLPDIYDIDFPETAVPYSSRDNLHAEQYGVYGQLRLSIVDPLTIALGGRFTNYSAKSRSGLDTYGAYSTTGDVNGHFTPSVGIVFDASEHVTLYGSYSTIFASQTQKTVTGEFLKPRTGRQFEIGVKATLLDGALNATGALFNVEDKGRALADPDNLDFSIAAGKVRSRGIEAELSGEPLPGWSVFAGYTYLETKYLNDTANLGKTFSLEEPRHTLKLWNTYRVGEIEEPGFQFGGGVRVMSKTSRGVPVQNAYAVVDAQVGYRLNAQWSATFTVNNLFDKSYFTRIPDRFFGLYGSPRNFTITLRKGF